MKARLRTEIDNVARRSKLQGYEIPRDFIVENEPFSKANHLLTDSSKPARGKLKARCAPRLWTALSALPLFLVRSDRWLHKLLHSC